MCRWAAYLGEPIFLEEIVSRPGHSLIQQASGATRCHTAINADGFGIAWYDRRPEPGLFRDTLPAWSDPNLKSLVRQVKSGLFLAHVRASTGTATSRNNCHPFTVGRWSFMHNGQVGGYELYRRDADMMIPDELYRYRRGATDSEALFLVALAEGLDRDPKGALERMAARFIEMGHARAGEGGHLRMSLALSDGETLYAVRYASDAAVNPAPSLYYQWNESLKGMAVVSEPLEETDTGWIEIPNGSFCIFRERKLHILPFVPAAPAAVAA